MEAAREPAMEAAREPAMEAAREPASGQCSPVNQISSIYWQRNNDKFLLLLLLLLVDPPCRNVALHSSLVIHSFNATGTYCRRKRRDGEGGDVAHTSTHAKKPITGATEAVAMRLPMSARFSSCVHACLPASRR
eukprot:GHVU01133576.1.p2 GENE.GHVU01133576.1~~GHVU01133576.1.p2  ORF type:complete len:134 (-),score=16.54 GHVU01133576.1:955-1356(-)